MIWADETCQPLTAPSASRVNYDNRSLWTRITNPFTFTGRRYDPETGLYYYRARYYDPKLGRFISRDPIGFEGSKWNLYEYVHSSPLRWRDPLGLAVKVCCRDVNVNPLVDTVTDTVGAKHCWIKTSTVEAGLGPMGDPDELPLSPWYGTQTSINDHSGEVGGSCNEVPGCNEECVNKELKIGTCMGDWEFGKNCNTFVRDVMKKCNCPNKCLRYRPSMRLCSFTPDCIKWTYPDK